MRSTRLLVLLAALSLSAPLSAQTDGTCIPVAERNGRKLGCFITARQELGALQARPPLLLGTSTRTDARARRARTWA